MKKSKHKRSSKKNNSKGSSSSNGENDLTSEDMLNIQLLNFQLVGVTLSLYANTLLYEAYTKSYDLIYNKENVTSEDKLQIDTIILKALYAFLTSALISAQIANTRYKVISDKINKGEVNFSIQPNVDLFIANVLNVTANIYYIKGAKGIYDRDNIQPIFGI